MPHRGCLVVHGAILVVDLTKNLIFGHLVRLNGLWSLHLDCWPTSNVGIGSHWPYQWVLDIWYDTQGGHISYLVVLDKPQSLRFDRWTSASVERGPIDLTSFWCFISLIGGRWGSWGPFLLAGLTWISFFGHFVALDGPQSLNLDCFLTSYVGIGIRKPCQSVFDIKYKPLRGQKSLFGSLFSNHVGQGQLEILQPTFFIGLNYLSKTCLKNAQKVPSNRTLPLGFQQGSKPPSPQTSKSPPTTTATGQVPPSVLT